MTRTVRKVLAYVTRGDELLVFLHRDFPDAGLQVPAGTIEDNERPEDAVFREVLEESGLQNVRLVKFLGSYEYDARPYRDEIHLRHVYHLELTEHTPPEWTHFEAHTSDGSPPIAFNFFWMSLGDPELNLSGNQGDMLWKLRTK